MLTASDIQKILDAYPSIAARVIPASQDECWNWTGMVRDGYAKIKLPPYDDNTSVHRFVYQLVHGPIPHETPVVRHSCDNRRCINPNHLLAGTIDDNVRDRQDRKRQARGMSSGRRKVTEADVVYIRTNYVPYKTPLKKFSDELGITIDQVHRIAKGKSWKHITITEAKA